MNDDTLLDDALRGVDVPGGLPAKLRPESLFADAEIDRILGNVKVPTALADSIRAAVRSQELQGTSRGAVLTGSNAVRREAHSRPKVAPRGGQPPSFLAPFARDIASIVMALSMVIMLGLASIEFSRRLEGPVPGRQAITRLDFEETEDETPGDRSLRLDVPDGPWLDPEPPIAVRPVPPDEPVTVPVVPPDPAAVLAELSDETSVGVRPARPRIFRGAPVPPTPGRTATPPMTTVDLPETARRRVPRLRGYDLAYEMATGEQPFVDPAVNPFLATDRPPLVLRTNGFEALTSTRVGQRGPIRAEEVLAAVPPPPNLTVKSGEVGLAIHEVRGLRTLESASTVLVEVAAMAGPLPRPRHPIEATLVLDHSAADEPAVWRRICRAMAALAPQLGDADKVSVVLSGPRARTVLQGGDRLALAALAADLEWQPASATADLEAGLDLARPAGRVIVVAHAGTLEAAGSTVKTSLATWLAALSAAGGDRLACDPAGGTRFISIDSTNPLSTERGQPSFGQTWPDAVAIRRELMQQVLGHDTLVAHDCGFDVRFDPRRVSRYRLIGHRQSAVESLADDRPKGPDLHAGETVRVVYEVIPRMPDAVSGLASATIDWTSPRGTRESLHAAPNRSTMDLGEGLPSPHGCELLLAVGLGELAGESAHAGPRSALTATLEKIVAEWRTRGDVTGLGEALARSLEQRKPRFRKPS